MPLALVIGYENILILKKINDSRLRFARTKIATQTIFPKTEFLYNLTNTTG
jgi:hypothetical protein